MKFYDFKRVRDSAKSSESPLRALTPKASALKGDSLDLAESRTRARRSRETTKWSDSKRPYLEIDVSSSANSFEIEKLRLSAFQYGAFC